MRRFSTTQRRICVGAFALVAAPLLLASVASACTQLKNLTANPNSGPAGATIKVAGTNYVTGANIGPVEIRIDSRSAAPIATLPVASINPVGNTISLDVVIPASASVGYHTLIATQHNTSTGALLNGFPVRAAYKVTAAAGTRETEPVADSASVAAAEPAAPAMASVGGSTASAAVTGSTPAAPAATGAASANAVVAAPAGPTGSATAGASAAQTATPAATAAATPVGAQAVETSTPALGIAPAPAPTLVTSDLMTAAAERSTSVLPKVMLAFGAAMVLLSVAASLRSGRSMLSGRRPGSTA